MSALRPEVVRRMSHEDHRLCEVELKSHPDYSPGYGTPREFTCSCGRVFVYVSEESEGAGWEYVGP